jgi:hypothetical protein
VNEMDFGFSCLATDFMFGGGVCVLCLVSMSGILTGEKVTHP